MTLGEEFFTELTDKLGWTLPERIEPGDNPLFEMHSKLVESVRGDHIKEFRLFKHRTPCCMVFSWAVPTERALKFIGKHGPVVEMGAGTGYWAGLLRAYGYDVLALDKEPYDNAQAKFQWSKVEKGVAEDLSKVDPARNLFLCWPPYASPMGYDALMHFKGKRVFYIGEGYGGCTGDDAFHELLEERFVHEHTMLIPSWPAVHDSLTMWVRK